jgi:hypothetical protein
MKDILQYFLDRKKVWLFPVVALLLIIGFILVVAGGTAVSPFIYALF